MRETLYGLFVLLGIYGITLGNGASIETQKKKLWDGSAEIAIDNQRVESEEVAARVASPSTIVEDSRRSLADTGFAFLDSRTIPSGYVKKARSKRDAVTDDDDAVVGAPADSVSHDVVHKEGKSLKRSVSSSPSLKGHMPKKHRAKQHRGRRRCKKRFGCRRSGGRGRKGKLRGYKRLEHRKSLQQQYNPHNNRNVEIQLFVGNRSLEMFRQELAAAASANTVKVPKKSNNDRSVDSSSKKGDNTPKDTGSKRKHVNSDISNTKKSPKKRVKLSNGKHGGGRANKTMENTGVNLLRRQKFEASKNSSVDSSFRGRNKSNYQKHLSILDVSSPQKVWQNVSRDESWKKSFENKTESNFSIDDIKKDSGVTVNSGSSTDEDYPDKIFASIYMPIEDGLVIHKNVVALISRHFETVENSTTSKEADFGLSGDAEEGKNLLITENEDDLCNKWLDSNEKLDEASLGPLGSLPACPCYYPSNILNDDKIWDEHQRKHFRWRDVSTASDRLDIYKPGASYCVRSLMARGSGHTAVQHCCYDGQSRLLTRGSGAGTPNFVSPEVSSKLHERIDILPWRLCKGDFTRYNKVRAPNNDNHCKTNPEDEEYRRQIENTKYHR